ncbi:MAG: type II secretion system F family protein [Deltaproteobacteria bacterium]|nr:type II secretion system F family protein [Deltaproteobacteria bacterium]
MIPLIIAMLFFFLILLFGISLFYLLKDRKTQEKNKIINKLVKSAPVNNASGTILIAEKSYGQIEKIFSRFLDLATLEAMLIASNVPMALDRLLTYSLGIGIIFVLPVVVIFRSPYPVIPALILGMTLPFLYIMYRKKKREETLVEQLPDALDMIVRALRVGQSVDGALQEVARSFLPPMGSEIKKIYDEMTMGLPFEKAFRNFEKRFSKIPEVKILTTAFIIQRETGGNLTTVLEGVAQTVRERFQLKRQIQVLTAEGRLSAIILGLLPFAFLLIALLFNSKYISLLFTHPMGKKLLFLAVLLELSGFVIMRIISRIRV